MSVRGKSLRFMSSGMAVILVAAVAFALLAYLAVRVNHDSAALRSSPKDNVQWTVSRMEVETLRLQHALMDSEHSLRDVRRRFDVFYSRVVLFQEADLFAPLREDPESRADIDKAVDFLASTTPIMDGDDETLSAQRSHLADQLDTVRAASVSLALHANAHFNKVAVERHAVFESLVIVAQLVAGGLILILASTLYILHSRSRLAIQKQVEASNSNARLEAVSRVAMDPIVIADGKGTIVEYNEAAETVFGYSREEAIGANMGTIFIPEEMREAHAQGMVRYQKTREARVVGQGRLELEAVRKSGERFPVELAVGEARGVGKDDQIFVGFMRDISSRKKAEVDLTRARDAALAADRAKSRFIAVMSHEMRTPLNGVLGVLDLLEDTELDEKQAEYVEVATTSGEILLGHINDVLDITRIEAGHLEVSEEPFSVEEIVQEAAAVGRPGAEAKGAKVNLSTSNLPASLLGDPRRVRQVLLNLVGNAVKFTSDGSINISAKLVGKTASGCKIEFEVRDTGPGISEEDQRKIFDDFVTLDSTYTREATGSGLGLSISRRIVNAMGGEIGVKSSPGLGSRFWFTVTFPRAESAKAPAADKEMITVAPDNPIRALHVLLVEDNAVNRMVARRMLEAEGLSVKEARDGVEGVEAATRERFDVILMDVSMPRMDGIEATKRILRQGMNTETPVIGLTAHAAPAEQASFFDAGMTACLIKPLRRGDLRKVLAEASVKGSAAAVEVVEDVPMIHEEVFDEFIAAMPDGEAGKMLQRITDELRSVGGELGDIQVSELAAFAHQAAGVAALIGASRAHAALRSVETMAKSGQRNIGDINKAREEIAAVVAVISEFSED